MRLFQQFISYRSEFLSLKYTNCKKLCKELRSSSCLDTITRIYLVTYGTCVFINHSSITPQNAFLTKVKSRNGAWIWQIYINQYKQIQLPANIIWFDITQTWTQFYHITFMALAAVHCILWWICTLIDRHGCFQVTLYVNLSAQNRFILKC